MRHSTMIPLGGLLLLALMAGAAGPPPVPEREPDQLDYTFFASDRPVLIRLHVRIGEKPYDTAWTAYLDKLFAWFDKNRDGFLNATEVGRLIQPNILQSQIQGSIGGGGGPAVAIGTLDTNKDGKVSKEEFRNYYRNNGMAPLRFFFNTYQANEAKKVNDAIYKRLDANKDGKLTREELARLPSLVRSLDENEDELLTAAELNTDSTQNVAYAVPFSGPVAAPTIPQEPGLIELGKGMTPANLVPQLVVRYDRNKDGKLARNEIAFDRATFDELDANKDDFLDQAELVGFFKRPPDLVFRARVGRLNPVGGFLSKIGLARPGSASRTEAMPIKGKPMALAKIVKRVDGDTVEFPLGDANFSLQANEGQTNQYNGARQFYLQQFDTLADKKGYVAKAQEKENAQNPYVFQIFRYADKDADDKLQRKELVAWLDLVTEGSNCHVSLQADDMGRSLFGVIDRSADTQLSIREMRSAWERIKPLCKDGTALAQTDLPRTIRISVGQGNTYYRGRILPTANVSSGPVVMRMPVAMPVWFRKMDRNNDGDISLKEWLGTEEDFKEMDADGDGLISLAEARAFETKKRTAKK